MNHFGYHNSFSSQRSSDESVYSLPFFHHNSPKQEPVLQGNSSCAGDSDDLSHESHCLSDFSSVSSSDEEDSQPAFSPSDVLDSWIFQEVSGLCLPHSKEEFKTAEILAVSLLHPGFEDCIDTVFSNVPRESGSILWNETIDSVLLVPKKIWKRSYWMTLQQYNSMNIQWLDSFDVYFFGTFILHDDSWDVSDYFLLAIEYVSDPNSSKQNHFVLFPPFDEKRFLGHLMLFRYNSKTKSFSSCVLTDKHILDNMNQDLD